MQAATRVQWYVFVFRIFIQDEGVTVLQTKKNLWLCIVTLESHGQAPLTSLPNKCELQKKITDVGIVWNWSQIHQYFLLVLGCDNKFYVFVRSMLRTKYVFIFILLETYFPKYVKNYTINSLSVGKNVYYTMQYATRNCRIFFLSIDLCDRGK